MKRADQFPPCIREGKHPVGSSISERQKKSHYIGFLSGYTLARNWRKQSYCVSVVPPSPQLGMKVIWKPIPQHLGDAYCLGFHKQQTKKVCIRHWSAAEEREESLIQGFWEDISHAPKKYIWDAYSVILGENSMYLCKCNIQSAHSADCVAINNSLSIILSHRKLAL